MSSFSTTRGGDVPSNDSTDVYRVMIVDDSAVIRGAIARVLEGDPSLRVAASLCNGEMAIKSLQNEPVDVIVLDIEMPVMDGLTALPKLKAIDGAVQVIMASTLTQKNAEISLRAMSLGATDYIPKPSTSREMAGTADDFRRELVGKVKALGALARRSGVRVSTAHARVPYPPSRDATSTTMRPSAAPRPFTPAPAVKKEVVLRREALVHPDVIAIGSSTGGPQALFRVVKDMGGDLAQPVVITQHMPPSFTAILAEHISKQCQVNCAEAKDGETLQARRYYVAPGDFHMLIENRAAGPTIRLTKDPQENFCRPAVDPMLRTLAAAYGKRILAVILTGMGQDGTKGCDVVVKAGGSVIAQDEASSVVWGMPGSVANAGLCSAVLPVGEIGGLVRQTAMRRL